jgi:protein-tyrosine phosphatase
VAAWFRKNVVPISPYSLTVDVHSHLLPGIDDGVQSLEEAESIVLKFKQLGYSKLITSPHVHELYRNTTATIQNKLIELRAHLHAKNIDVHIDTIAEYSLDEWLMRELEAGTPLLTFNGKYLLFETNFFAEPLVLNDFIFKLITQHYIPVLAHPERYMYLINNKNRIEDLASRGVLFQLNSTSLAGMYGPVVEKLAKFLVDEKCVHILGSDCHNMNYMNALADAQKTTYYKKALALPLLNYSL